MAKAARSSVFAKHMSVMPKISIVTISLNQAQFLEGCMRSVEAQDYENIEHIIVDPGSTDGSREIIQQHGTTIHRAILEPDRGPADGLNKGFSVATGDIYGFINADDLLLPGALNFVGRYFNAYRDIDVLSGAIRIIDQHGKSSIRRRTADPFDLARYAAGVCTICQQATFFRSTAFRKVGGFRADNRATWDGELLVDMALSGCKFSTVDKVLGAFRIYPNSITGSRKFSQRQVEEYAYIREKMRAAGVSLHPPLKEKFLRLSYKLNLFRHLRYLRVEDVSLTNDRLFPAACPDVSRND